MYTHGAQKTVLIHEYSEHFQAGYLYNINFIYLIDHLKIIPTLIISMKMIKILFFIDSATLQIVVNKKKSFFLIIFLVFKIFIGSVCVCMCFLKIQLYPLSFLRYFTYNLKNFNLKMVWLLYTDRNAHWNTVARNAVEKVSPFGLDITPLIPKRPIGAQTVDTFLKFAFQMDSIVLNLRTGAYKTFCFIIHILHHQTLMFFFIKMLMRVWLRAVSISYV